MQLHVYFHNICGSYSGKCVSGPNKVAERGSGIRMLVLSDANLKRATRF
jgi:hypothetical protein